MKSCPFPRGLFPADTHTVLQSWAVSLWSSWFSLPFPVPFQWCQAHSFSQVHVHCSKPPLCLQ